MINTCQSVLTLSHGKEIYATECLPIIRLLYVNVKYHEFVWILEKSWIGKKKKKPREGSRGSHACKYPRGGRSEVRLLSAVPRARTRGPGGSPWVPGAVLCPQCCGPGSGCAERCWGPSWRAPAPPGHGLGTSWGWPCWGALGQRDPEVPPASATWRLWENAISLEARFLRSLIVSRIYFTFQQQPLKKFSNRQLSASSILRRPSPEIITAVLASGYIQNLK